MTAAAIGAALAWLIISLHVKTHGGSFLGWFLGFWANAIVVQAMMIIGEALR